LFIVAFHQQAIRFTRQLADFFGVCQPRALGVQVIFFAGVKVGNLNFIHLKGQLVNTPCQLLGILRQSL